MIETSTKNSIIKIENLNANNKIIRVTKIENKDQLRTFFLKTEAMLQLMKFPITNWIVPLKESNEFFGFESNFICVLGFGFGGKRNI